MKEDITRAEIKDWSSKQEVYTLARRKFKRPVVIAFSENYQWDSDTANIINMKNLIKVMLILPFLLIFLQDFYIHTL